ncbi:hypothetical protein P8452_30489 [Trifolium repens]|nr:hypothetical protein P8452_30489 [Trifolium repens]
MNRTLIIFLCLIVLVTGEGHLFCYNRTLHCDLNPHACRAGYVMKCHLFRCNCEPVELKKNSMLFLNV